MLTKWMALPLAALLVCCSLSGCASARDSAEDAMDNDVQKDFVGASVYVSSRDVEGSATFMPDPSLPDLMLMANCFKADRDDIPLMKVTQDDVLITEFGTACEGGDGYGGMRPALFDPAGGEVTVEITSEDAQVMTFRVIGYTAPF